MTGKRTVAGVYGGEIRLGTRTFMTMFGMPEQVAGRSCFRPFVAQENIVSRRFAIQVGVDLGYGDGSS